MLVARVKLSVCLPRGMPCQGHGFMYCNKHSGMCCCIALCLIWCDHIITRSSLMFKIFAAVAIGIQQPQRVGLVVRSIASLVSLLIVAGCSAMNPMAMYVSSLFHGGHACGIGCIDYSGACGQTLDSALVILFGLCIALFGLVTWWYSQRWLC